MIVVKWLVSSVVVLFLHQYFYIVFFLHKTILYYFLVFVCVCVFQLVILSRFNFYFAFSNCSHLTNNHLSHIFLFTYSMFCRYYGSSRSLSLAFSLSLSLALCFSHLCSIYICFLYSLVFYFLLLMFLFLFLSHLVCVCFWLLSA